MSDVQPVGATIELPNVAQMQEKIAALDTALKTNTPNMEVLLQTIHKNLSEDPALVHLLKDEQIAIIFRGLEQKTRTKILEDTVKSASSGGGKKALKNLDLGIDL